MLPGKFRFASFAAIAFFVWMATITGQPPVCQEVVQPKKVEPPMPTLPAIIEAYETTRIFAQIPGQCEDWNYDIGDRVKRGALLVKLYVPEVEQELRFVGVAIKQAQARVKVAKAFAEGAQAEVEAAKAGVSAAAGSIRGAQATVELREVQLKRAKDLFEKKAVVAIVVAEAQERQAVAASAMESAKAAWLMAKAKLVVQNAKVNQAEASVEAAENNLALAQAKYDQYHDRLHCRYIVAPFDGILTQRNCAKGDFVQPGPSAGDKTPLFVMQWIDIVRIVVAIPERDVPFVKPGDAAEVQVAAFPGKKWPGQIERLSGVVDPRTRCMRGEIHLRNTDERLRPGMSASVAIISLKGRK